MINLLKETKYTLTENGKTQYDVLWVGSKDGAYSITWDEYEIIADIEYDNGYGGAEIATDLVVVGQDWWLERGEYDGSEWWDFKSLPTRNLSNKVFHTCTGGMWDKLDKVNTTNQKDD